MRPRVRAAGTVACLALAGVVIGTTGIAGFGSPATQTAARPVGSAGTVDTASGAAPAVAPAEPTPTTATRGRPSAAAALQELRRVGGQQSAVRIVDGRLRTLAAAPGQPLKLPLGVSPGAGPNATATAFVDRYSSAFGLTAKHTTKRTSTDPLPGGDTVVRFSQYAGGLPVLGGQLVVTMNGTGGILGATAETSADAPVTTTARTTAPAAQRSAVQAVAKELHMDAGRLTAGKAALWLYDPRLVGAAGPAQLRPTWWVPVHGDSARTGRGVGSALVDATDSKVVLVMAEHRHARNRAVCDLADRQVDLNDGGSYWCSPDPSGPAVSRSEGGAASSVADVNKAYDYLGQTYDFYRNTFGRDSLDGKGMQVRATVRACDIGGCPFENAFWDGTQTVFGAGFAVDDVVAHEYTHGVTQHTSDLLYAFESGTINEAFSDIMGEFVDLANGTEGPRWRIGEDLPASIGALRDMADPTLFRQPAYVGGPYYYVGFQDNGGVHFNSGVVNKAAQLIADGGTLNGSTVTGLGLAKSAQLWYRVMHLVTTGSGFADLGAALEGACRQLVGRYGITRADCVQVDAAVAATALLQEPLFSWSQVVDRCAVSGHQPAVRLWQDDLEGNVGWTLDRAVWQYIPSADVPVSWAHSGRRALYGYVPNTAPAGFTGSATMRAPVTIPAGATYIALDYNVPTFSTATGGLAIEYDAGAGWQAVPAGVAPQPGGGSTFGYVTASYDVSSLAGKSVRFRFKITRTSQPREWLVDDVRLYQCVAAPSVPRHLSAQLDTAGTSAVVAWDRPAAGTAVDHYEVTYTPPLPGAPTTVAPGSGDTTSITLSGLNAIKTYAVTVRAVDASGGRSLPAELRFSVTAPVDCTKAGVIVVNGKPVPRCRTPYGK